MSQIVSPLMPFPNIKWCLLISHTDKVIFDTAEHYEKMTYRNRYYITGANGLIQLTIPLAQGRNQRTAMKDVQIDNTENWQQQHWRTIKSVYGRSPFFEHYAMSLESLFSTVYESLTDFNKATVKWLKRELRFAYKEEYSDVYVSEYKDVKDLRKRVKPSIEKIPVSEDEAIYYQMFKERNGFYKNLSILDLLFAEGPMAMQIIQGNTALINEW